ncbi:MAG: PilZ domain-containing protein [Isosphaeraceae bacterium]|nr:PilZ domain-containing protein [Isosphaeraceae bacterium]
MKPRTFDADVTPYAKHRTPFDLDDRRKEPRYEPVMDYAYLGWWEGATFRTEQAQIVNISAGGAALATAGKPNAGETVWLSVVGPAHHDWVAARLLEHRNGHARLVFADGYPYDLFKSVVWGLPGEQPGTPCQEPRGPLADDQSVAPIA